MRKRFAYERFSFDYDLLLERRKTVSATVFPDGRVVVKAPLHAEEQKIKDFLQRKIRWILAQQRYFSRFKSKPQKEYVSGETFRYLGRSYKLLVRRTKALERVSLQHGILLVLSRVPKDQSHTRMLLETWYKGKAHIIFYDRIAECASKYALKKVPGLVIRPMTHRWGSYSRRTNRICLNTELIRASRRQIDYVLTHEMCHIEHPSHGKAFKRLMNERFPGWDRVKTGLELELLSV